MSAKCADHLVAAGLVVFRRIKGNIEYLLLQTSYGKHHWTPPKGHVDPGETEMETALRETYEEAGLTEHHLNIIDGFKRTLHYNVSGVPKRVVYWLSELKDPNTCVVLSDEHIRFEWLTLERALELIAEYKDMQEILEAAEKVIKRSPTTNCESN